MSPQALVFLRSLEGELRGQDVRRAAILQNRTGFFLFTTTAGVACCELHWALLKIKQIPEAAAAPIVMRVVSNETQWNFCTVWMRAPASLEHV